MLRNDDKLLRTTMTKTRDEDSSIFFVCKKYRLKIEYTNPRKGHIYNNDIPLINCINSFNCNIEFY